MTPAIYQITNKVNNKKYVGQSINISKRKCQHFSELKRGTHKNKHLQHAANKYGINIFEFEVLLFCDKENLTLYEQMCVDGLNPEYNTQKECVTSSLGIKRSQETLQRMSESRLGKTLTDEHKKKLSQAKLGKTRIISEETRKKMSKAKMGCSFSDETRQKMSVSAKRRWQTDVK